MRAFQALVLLVVSLSSSLAGQVVTASFDDLPDGSGVGSHYPGAYIPAQAARDMGARSAPNVAICGYSPLQFATGALWVAFYGSGNIGAAGAYDTDGRYLGSASPQLIPGEWCPYFQLRFDRPIAKVRLAFPELSDCYIDDLSYEIVPEPSSLAALSLGLLAAGAGVRRRRRE